MKNKLNSIHILVFLFVFGSVCIAGCKEKLETPQPQPPKVQKSVKAAVPLQQQTSSAKVSPASEPQVSFSNYKDPFKPFITDVKKAPVVKKNRLGQALPILNYEVSQFKVSGIIVGLKQNSAMILDPTGKPYIVKAGMEIGRNEGRITKIAPNYIEVFEQYRDESGKRIKNTIRLTLPKKE